ncbi:transposase family protein [Actinoplanes sp. ATCC 53533]|uniref:transposase family protein n=1 Tax=Actinoplanes sp. ATCC 53533 TaxID=1288362 RepID=UPI001F1D2238|nr:transposase family protein [Actinoplanes sp. ATCC 53533]
MFSGEKHLSGQNVQVVADLDGRVADVGEPVDGARYDVAAFFISGIAQRWADHLTPGGPGMIGDGCYQGTGPIAPPKKPPGGELTTKQKAYSVNRLRAAVERVISHLKNWKILKTGYHRIMTDFPDVLRTVSALEIFRTAAPGFE